MSAAVVVCAPTPQEIKDGGVTTAKGVSGLIYRLRNGAPINITLDQIAAVCVSLHAKPAWNCDETVIA
jgi:hypothetical protein